MICMPASEARKDFSRTLSQVAYRGERVVLSRHDKNVAAIVSIEDLELLQRLENRADLDAAREALAEEGSIPWEQAKAELGLD